MEPFSDLTPEEDFLYSNNHLWCQKQPSALWHIGIDAFAARLFSYVHEFVFPTCGRQYSQASILLWVNSPAGMIGVRTPLPIYVIGINQAVREEPRIMLSDPQHTGWLLEGRLSPEENGHHMIPPQAIADRWYQDLEWLRTQVKSRIEQDIGSAAGDTLQDGGVYMHDLSHLLGINGYQHLLQKIMELR